jgi:hypothetical protein
MSFTENENKHLSAKKSEGDPLLLVIDILRTKKAF